MGVGWEKVCEREREGAASQQWGVVLFLSRAASLSLGLEASAVGVESRACARARSLSQQRRAREKERERERKRERARQSERERAREFTMNDSWYQIINEQYDLRSCLPSLSPLPHPLLRFLYPRPMAYAGPRVPSSGVTRPSVTC